ncbi:hypothetical protein [Rhodoplanes sp. SY1]|uniref:hypothetical protein n=1 Tax=Rhodoplanes sp. SY1 TaxID=3166646 RepID=UPI0038B4C03B
MRALKSLFFRRAAATDPHFIRNAVAVAAAIGLVIAFIAMLQQAAKYVEIPIGCDDFGYLRQARLFVQHGPAGGLATAIADPLTLAVVELAKATGESPEAWQEAVAPHCHHYKPAVDRVVLQYPPGTGALLSVFPEGMRGRLLTRVLALALLAGLLAASLRSRTILGTVAAGALGVGLFRTLGWNAVSPSIPASLAAAVALGWLVAEKLDFSGRPTKSEWHALAGLVLGLSVAVRIPNGFMLAGFAACYGAAFLLRPSPTRLVAPAAFAGTFAFGLLPVLLANAINAGSLFATTYSTVDAAPPVLDAERLTAGLQYFLIEHDRIGYAVGSAILLLVVLAVVQLRRPTGPSGFVLVIAGVNLVTNLGYFVLHDPRAPYYPIPLAAFVATAATFALRRRAEQGLSGLVPLSQGEVRLRRIAGGVALVIALVASAVVRTPVSPLFGPAGAHRAFDARTIVWADLTTGFFHYFQGRQASKLAVAAPAMQDRLVEAAARDGYAQVLIVDSPVGAALATRLEREGRLVPYGQAYGYDVYAVVPRHR